MLDIEVIISFQVRSPGELLYGYDSNRAQRELIAQLEAKNR